MKVLWLCNVMLPVIAGRFGLEASNKEGWIVGLAEQVMAGQAENGVELAIACPGADSLFLDGESVLQGELTYEGYPLTFFCFRENTSHPESYEPSLEESMKEILDRWQPDVIHCFGTEFPHTLAICRVAPDKGRLLIGIQGLCKVYAEAYFADLPEEVIRHKSFRDILKKDGLVEQHRKFVQRGELEKEAISLAKNITGRTEFDRYYSEKWNPNSTYFAMNETLRRPFYEARWRGEQCVPHSIFLSQGDYPVKGLHYMLEAMPKILRQYPDAKVYVAGNSLVGYATLKEKLKISGYGQYLRGLIRKNHLEGKVLFLGKLTGEQMRDRYLASSLFVCCSAMENSPNSLGEAMLLGMPCISADIGGVPNVFEAGVDGISYVGFRNERLDFYWRKGTVELPAGEQNPGDSRLQLIADRLADAVLRMWGESAKRQAVYGANARAHALFTHDGERNFCRLLEIYREITEQEE